jgi:hypothetical protein
LMGAADLLQHLHGAGFRVDVAGDKLLVSPGDRLTEADCDSIANNKPALIALIGRAESLSSERPHDFLTLVAWTDADIAAYCVRRDRLIRWGWAEPEAEKLAERLVKRDREQDDRVTCVECSHYRPGRCGNHQGAGLHSPESGRDLAAMLQRCPGFTGPRP